MDALRKMGKRSFIARSGTTSRCRSTAYGWSFRKRRHGTCNRPGERAVLSDWHDGAGADGRWYAALAAEGRDCGGLRARWQDAGAGAASEPENAAGVSGGESHLRDRWLS